MVLHITNVCADGFRYIDVDGLGHKAYGREELRGVGRGVMSAGTNCNSSVSQNQKRR
jgi:hypothetical protein